MLLPVDPQREETVERLDRSAAAAVAAAQTHEISWLLDGEPSSQLFHDALHASGTGAWQTVFATRERWWSPEMLAVHGLLSHDQAPQDYFELVHPDDRAAVEAALQESLLSGRHEVQYRVVWPDHSVHWLRGIGRTRRDAQGVPSVIIGICSLIDDQKRQERDLRFLAEAATEFARSSDYEQTLRSVAAMAVPHFADWCAVDVLEDGDRLRRLAVAHVDPDKRALAQELHDRYPPDRRSPHGLWQVLRSGEPHLVATITDELLRAGAQDEQHLRIVRSLGLRSYMAVPLVGVQGVMGAITFVSSDSGRVYGQRDLTVAKDLVSRAAISIQNARLVEQLRRSQERQHFLLTLTDALRVTGSMPELLGRVCELLVERFRVNRVGYGHVDAHEDVLDFEVCRTDGSVPPLLGRFPASAFGQQVIDRLRAGAAVAMPDVRSDPLTADEAAQQTSHEVDTRAVLVVPLFKAGRLRTIVYLNARDARDWSADEVSLMQEVAERTRELIERGRAEQGLRESEARWRGLFEHMNEGFFLADAIRDADGRMADFRFREVNRAFERLTGLSPDSAVGRPVSAAIPGVPQELIDIYAKVVDSGEPAEFEVHVPALDNRWYEARAMRVAPDQFSVLFLEITQRKTIQQALAGTAERYRTLFDSIDEGFCVMQVLFDDAGRPRDYRFLEINPAFERQSGLKGAAGRTIRELVPDIESTYIETIGKVALTGEPIRFESHAQTLGRWFDAYAFRVGDPVAAQVALLFTDITERRGAQQALVERELELRDAHHLAGTGAWRWHAATNRTEASPELLRLLGHEDEGGLPVYEQQRGTLYPEADWQRLDACVQSALRTGEPYMVDLRARRKDGGEVWVTSRGSVVRDAAGAIVGLRGTLQDITERKKIEEALREADARKDEFLATLAHELRNPLAPLRNGLAILRQPGVDGAVALRARELMERQVSHMVRLVDDLLDVSRVTQGKVMLKKSTVSLQALVEMALETAGPLIEANGHRLVVTLPHEPVRLHVDPTRLAQVVSNILGNAAKYTPPGGDIALRARTADGERLCIEVQDSGVGIPAGMAEKVFELFTQLRDTIERAQGGLGIGLSLSRRLVELHGGTIRASSAGSGQGSTFVVELPLTSTSPAEASPAGAADAPAPAAARRARVLVVDDNRDAAESLSLLLELEGAEVRVAHCAVDGYDEAVRFEPQLVFLDIGLPDMSGYELATRLRRLPGVREALLVAVTGWGGARHEIESRNAGIDRHLTKPVLAGELLRLLAAA